MEIWHLKKLSISFNISVEHFEYYLRIFPEIGRASSGKMIKSRDIRLRWRNGKCENPMGNAKFH